MSDDTDKKPTETTDVPRPEETYVEPEGPIESEFEHRNDSNPASVRPQFHPPVMQEEHKGQTLAIVGLVLSILPLQLIGFILLVIALIKGLKSDRVKTISIIGLVINVLMTGIVLSIVVTAYQGVSQRATETYNAAAKREADAKAKEDTKAKTDPDTSLLPDSKSTIPADMQQRITEAQTDLTKSSTASLAVILMAQTAYNTTGKLPAAKADFKQMIPGASFTTLTAKPTDPTQVEYAICAKGTIMRVAFWDYTTESILYRYESPVAGGPKTASDCTVVV